jgi:hypothetical protein
MPRIRRSIMKSEKHIEEFEKTLSQIEALHDEISIISKKAPNDLLNKYKVGLVNTIISRANKLLRSDLLPFSDFKAFDVDELPSNSDVVVMLKQYMACLEKERENSIKVNFGDWYWVINGKETTLKTYPPKKLGKEKL